MSRTMQRNGQKVFDTIGEITGWGRGVWHKPMTVKQVADKCLMNERTVRKYMDIMAEAGTLIKTKVHSKLAVYIVDRKE